MAFLLLTEGSTLGDLRVTSLIIIVGGGGAVLYATVVKVFFSGASIN
jgi:hypothetical protein